MSVVQELLELSAFFLRKCMYLAAGIADAILKILNEIHLFRLTSFHFFLLLFSEEKSVNVTGD